MTARLPVEIGVGALLRRVNDAGGLAMVLARGDRQDGSLLFVTYRKSVFSGFYQREPGQGGVPTLARIGPGDDADSDQIATFWQRRRQFDPDLWVIELDIVAAERFAAETFLID